MRTEQLEKDCAFQLRQQRAEMRSHETQQLQGFAGITEEELAAHKHLHQCESGLFHRTNWPYSNTMKQLLKRSIIA